MRRILTAIVLIPAVVCWVLWGPAWLLAVVVAAIAELGVWEFFRLAEAKGDRVLRAPGYAFTAAIAILALGDSTAARWLGWLVLFLLLLMSWAMLSQPEIGSFLNSVGRTFFGIFYVAVPLGLFLWVCLRPGGRLAALFALVVVWTGDTVAFFAGSAWGRHKLAPRISPGKTWEGSAAALLAAVLMALAFVRILWREAGYAEVLVLAAAINVAAQAGDLAESALKRSAGVKDSSQLVPGHGGVLDRLDALLFAAPVLWYYWLWKSP